MIEWLLKKNQSDPGMREKHYFSFFNDSITKQNLLKVMYLFTFTFII